MSNNGVQLVELLQAGQPNRIWEPSLGQTTASLKEYWLQTSFLPNQDSATKVITEAYQILSNTELREKYDQAQPISETILIPPLKVFTDCFTMIVLKRKFEEVCVREI